MIPILSFALGGVRVLVPESELDRAREIYTAIQRGELDLDEAY